MDNWQGAFIVMITAGASAGVGYAVFNDMWVAMSLMALLMLGILGIYEIVNCLMKILKELKKLNESNNLHKG